MCLDDKDPLPDLTERTNRYLLNLRLAHQIIQKQYERLIVKSNEVQLAHLYYLPKAHKPGTPLRPIISGMRHPIVKISEFLDELLQPLFNQIASKTTVKCGFEVFQQLNAWSTDKLCSTTLLGIMDVIDLYTGESMETLPLSWKNFSWAPPHCGNDGASLKNIFGNKIGWSL